ncbi:MAG: TetR/AcrR family transcriptional regulator [Bacillota bacterium]
MTIKKTKQTQHPLLLEIGSTITDENLVRERRRQLAEAASELFEAKGYHNTNVAEIAELARMSIGSVYRYVTNKQDILALIFVYMNELYDEELDRVRELELQPWCKLSRMVQGYYRTIDIHTSKILLACRYTMELNKQGRDYAKQEDISREKKLGDVVKAGIDQGFFRTVDADMLAFNIVGAGQMWALKRWHLKKLMTIEDYIELQLDYLRAYLGV